MKKVLYYLRENLEITNREAKSTLAFLLISLVSVTLYVSVNFITQSRKAHYTLQKYVSEPPLKDSSAKSADLSRIKTSKFRFDPNAATKDELVGLGVPPQVARTVENYRNKGGKFRYREDLQKIYRFPPEVYAELEGWINLPSKFNTPQPPSAKVNPDTIIRKRDSRPPQAPLDINSADSTDLKTLRGIGTVYAARIIRFRDALGGFHSIDQLDETYGIAPEALITLKKNVFIGTPVISIYINETGPFKHPYIKPYQVKTLISYRNQHGKFQSAEDLYQIKVLDEETIQKIKPYLSF